MIPLRDSVRSKRVPIVNYLLIAVNLAVFAYQLRIASVGTLDNFISQCAVTPTLLLREPFNYYHTLIASQFLHGGVMHILGNMAYLYIFGDNIEDKLGHGGYLIFYLFSGICASFFQIYLNPASTIPMLGASGAIAGVLGAYFVLYPKATVETLIPLGFFTRVVEIPAFFFLGFWFLMQAYSGTAATAVAKSVGQNVGGVAWWAHVGGFSVGVIGGILSRFRVI